MRRCADKGHAPLLHLGEQHVLLGAAEAVDLVHEQDGRPPARLQLGPRLGGLLAQLLHPGRGGVERAEAARVCRAMTWASDVLPQPGGPWKINEPSRSAAMSRRRSLPGPRKWSWPMNSSRVAGRIRAASGWARKVGGVRGGEQVGRCVALLAHAPILQDDGPCPKAGCGPRPSGKTERPAPGETPDSYQQAVGT